MAKIQIIEDCLAPSRYIYLEFTGKNPFGVASKIAEMLQPFFSVSSAGVSETDFRWDTSGDPIGFYFTWWVEKADMGGRFSKQMFYIKCEGKQTKESREGNFTLQLNANLITEFSSNSPFMKGLYWFYDYVFYNRRRSEYLKDCRDLCHDFRDEIKKHFNLAVLETRG